MIPFMLYTLASGPAGISTACDGLKAALNQVRLDDLTKATSERVARLERALDRENNGGGIGFTVLGTVVNKRMLNQIASGVVGLVLFVLPLVLQSAVRLSPESLIELEESLIAPLRVENAALLAALDAQNVTLRAALDAINAKCGQCV
jgi:hypothetical protein